MHLRESLPRPRNFCLHVGGSQAGDEQVVQDRKSLLPSLRATNPFHEIQRSPSPDAADDCVGPLKKVKTTMIFANRGVEGSV
jgi:hypothetical protein